MSAYLRLANEGPALLMQSQGLNTGASMYNLHRGSDLILSLTPCCATAYFLVVSRLHNINQGIEIGCQGVPIDARRAKNSASIVRLYRGWYVHPTCTATIQTPV